MMTTTPEGEEIIFSGIRKKQQRIDENHSKLPELLQTKDTQELLKTKAFEEKGDLWASHMKVKKELISFR